MQPLDLLFHTRKQTLALFFFFFFFTPLCSIIGFFFFTCREYVESVSAETFWQSKLPSAYWLQIQKAGIYMHISEIEMKILHMCLLLEYECEKSKKRIAAHSSGGVVCGAWAQAHRCVSNMLPSVYFSAVHLLCGARLSTLVSLTQIVLVHCSCACSESQTDTSSSSSSTTIIFFKWQIANYGGRESSTHCRFRKHTARRHDAWKFKRDFEHTHTHAAGVRFGATEEWNALKQTQHQQLWRVFAKFTTRALQITHCKHCRALLQHGSWPACVVNTCNGVVSICTCFPYLCIFFA